MAKVLLAIFVGLFRRRPLPVEGKPPDRPEGEPVAAGTAMSSAAPHGRAS